MPSVWEQVKQFRDQGYTLQGIGDKFGLTRERVRQILEEHYGTARTSGFIAREALARLLGCSGEQLARLEKQGVLHPIHLGAYYLYGRDEVEKAALEIMRPPPPDVERVCEVCGKKFYVRPYQIRPTSPRRFCSKRCQGVYIGRHYGFGVHGKGGGAKRKWDYGQVYKLREETGWGVRRIGRALGIPEPTVNNILRKRFGTPLPRVKPLRPKTTSAYYWTGDDFELAIAKGKGGLVAMMIKKGNNHQTAIFSHKQFFSFVCEVVKYILNLPAVARRIPFYESCAAHPEKFHGSLQSVKLKIDEDGNVQINLYAPWARYHGIKEGDEIIWWEEDGVLLSSPVKTKATIIKDSPPRWQGKESFVTKVTKRKGERANVEEKNHAGGASH